MFARMIILSSDMRSVYKNIDKHWPWMLPSSHVKPGNTRLIFERLKLRAPFLFHSIGKFPGLNSQDIQLDFILLEMIVWSVTLVPKTCLWMNVLKGNGIQSIVSGYFVIVMVWEHLTRTRAHSYCGTIQKGNPWLLSSGAFAPINISQLFHWSKPIKASNLRHPMCVCVCVYCNWAMCVEARKKTGKTVANSKSEDWSLFHIGECVKKVQGNKVISSWWMRGEGLLKNWTCTASPIRFAFVFDQRSE